MTYTVHRLGIIGLGNRARALIRAAEASGRFEIVAATDDSAESAPVALGSLAGGTRILAGADDVLAQSVDAVAIAVPNHRHHDIALRAAARGIPVFLEKPIATNLVETFEVIEAFRSSQTLLRIGTELRHAPSTRFLHDRLDQKVLSAPQLLWAHEFREPFRPGAGGWRTSQALTGGLFLEKNCHHFDLFALLAGARPCEVTARGIGSDSSPLQVGGALVEFADGAIGQLSVSMRLRGQRLQWGAVGDGWRYDYDSLHDTAELTTSDAVTGPRGIAGFDGFDHPGEVEQWVSFADELETGTQDPLSRDSGLWGHVIAFAAEESAARRTTVRIDEHGTIS